MQGSLRLHAGVLYVGRHELTAEVASYDLDGRPLETSFRFRDERFGRSSADGIDVDEDHRLWIADAAARRVRCFTLFGVEVASVGEDAVDCALPRDARGDLGAPVDLRVVGADDELTLLIASGGDRRHALQVLHPAGGKGSSIAPLGDPEAHFRRIRGIDWCGGELAVCESSARRIQIFEGDPLTRLVFRFAFAIPDGIGDPEAVSLVGDGRILVATRGEASGLFVFDAAGRPLARIAEDAQMESRLAGRMPNRKEGAVTAFGDASVDQPSALAFEPGASDRDARVCVLDREGERVQVFSLDGRSFGEILRFA